MLINQHRIRITLPLWMWKPTNLGMEHFWEFSRPSLILSCAASVIVWRWKIQDGLATKKDCLIAFNLDWFLETMEQSKWVKCGETHYHMTFNNVYLQLNSELHYCIGAWFVQNDDFSDSYHYKFWPNRQTKT